MPATCPDLYHLTDVQRRYAPDGRHICHLATAIPVSLPIPLERAVGAMPHEINGIILVLVCLLYVLLFWKAGFAALLPSILHQNV